MRRDLSVQGRVLRVARGRVRRRGGGRWGGAYRVGRGRGGGARGDGYRGGLVVGRHQIRQSRGGVGVGATGCVGGVARGGARAVLLGPV